MKDDCAPSCGSCGVVYGGYAIASRIQDQASCAHLLRNFILPRAPFCTSSCQQKQIPFLLAGCLPQPSHSQAQASPILSSNACLP